MQKTLIRRGGAWLVLIAMLLSLLPTSAFAAEGGTVYTDMSYKGTERGTESQPYADFETAVANAKDGDTIVIKGKAYANVKEDSGVSPLVIDKRVTITGYNGAAGELYVRAGGIVLGADVTMTDVELDLANKYHNAIFANGYAFTANNVTRGSGSREVHLFAGSIGAGTQVTAQIPASGANAVLTLTNSTFGSIYAGGVADGFNGDVSITAKGSTLGSVYGCGAQEKAPDGNWFDTSEPAAPTADSQYAAAGSVTVITDADSIKTVDALGNENTAVTVNDAWESRLLTLSSVKTLTVNGGKATVAELDDTAAVTVSGNASLDLSRLEQATIGSLTGEGTLILGKTQTLNITGSFDGAWTFETVNGFNGKSGAAEYGHTYITTGSGNAEVSFQPHATQGDMTLGKNGNEWKTSAAPETLTYVTTFDIVEESVTVSKEKINQDGVELNVNWMNPSQTPQLIMIPLRYEIHFNGVKHEIAAEKDPDDGSYMANFATGNMLLYADDTLDNGKSLLVIGNNGTDIEAGIYQFSVFAPDADGSEIRQDFTLIVTDGAEKTNTTIHADAQNAEFGEAFSATASVQADGSELTGAALEYWLNGQKITSLTDLKVLLENGFRLGENELRVVYAGDDTHLPSVAAKTFTVSKASASITGYDLPADGPFTGSAYAVTRNNPRIEANGTVLNDSPVVTVEYQLDGKTVSAAVFPGTYTVVLNTFEEETYGAITQSIGVFIIEKAKPTVTVNAEDKGNGTVALTATVTGVDPYFAEGKIRFTWDDKTFEVTMTNGTVRSSVAGVSAGSHTYQAEYIPATDEPYYTGAASAEQSITIADPAPVKHTLRFDVDGGETTPAFPNQEVEVGGKPTKPADDPRRLGYEFKGWKYGTDLVDWDTFTMPNEDVTFTASWELGTYTIHFDKNLADATGTMADQTYKFDDSLGSTLKKNTYESPTKNFLGWAMESGTQTADYADEAAISEALKAELNELGTVTLYAVWKEKPAADVTVTFDVQTNGGQFADGKEDAKTQTGKAGEALTLPAVQERIGFTFTGWWTEATGGTKLTESAVIPAANTTYYAQWAEKDAVTVTLDSGDGVWNDGTTGEKQVSVKPGFTATIPGIVSRTGYTFDGWQSNNTTYRDLLAADEKTPEIQEGQAVRYTAKWKANIYLIHFSANGQADAEGTVADQAYSYDAPNAALTDLHFTSPTKKFLGWSLESTATTAAYEPGAGIDDAMKAAMVNSADGSVTLYAVWTDLDAVSMTFSAGDGAFADGSNETIESVLPGQQNALPAAPTRDGYLFVGWASGDAAYPDLAADATQTPAGIAGKNVTYTAKWEKLPATEYTVTFQSGSNGSFTTANDPLASQTVEDGKTVTGVPAITAGSGYTFSGWQIGGAGTVYTTEQVAAMPITADTTFVAAYTPISRYTVTFQSGSNGSFTTANDPLARQTVEDGKTVTGVPAITAGSGYTFNGWQIGGAGTVYTRAQVMAMAITKDIVFVASYTYTGDGSGGGGSTTTSYVIKASAGNGGSISPSGSVSVARGGNKTFTISAADGFAIADVLVDGKSVGTVSDYTFTNVKEDHTISVSFARKGGVADPDDTGVSGWLDTKNHVAFMVGYGNGSFGPGDQVTRAQVAQLFYRLLNDQNVPVTKTFADVPQNAWYAKAVGTLASLDIVTGVGDGKFDPDRAITRAEFTAIAARFAKASSEGELSFVDVPANAWYRDAVLTATNYGWITGVGDNRFAPQAQITRAEAATIVNRMLDRSADEEFVNSGAVRQFPDVSRSNWAYYQIMEASNGHGYRTDASGKESWTGLQ